MRVPQAAAKTAPAVTPGVAASWSRRISSFFESGAPRLSMLSEALAPTSQLDLADPNIRAAIQPVALAVQKAAREVLVAPSPASSGSRVKVEKLEVLTTVLRDYLSEDLREEVEQAWLKERERVSQKTRARIERKIKAFAKGLRSESTIALSQDTSVDASGAAYVPRRNALERPKGEESMEPIQQLEAAMPKPEPNGFVKTLNNMGYMTSTLDPYSQEFARFAPEAPGPVLDIGAAYGVATLAALKSGARVIANDIDSRHLAVLERRAPLKERARLSLAPGAFPDELHFEPGSVGAVLIARVLHFFDGPAIERAARTLFEWLAPGGKVFIVAETPYLKNFLSFIPTYEARKKEGHPWPGFVEDVMAVAPERGKSLPPRMHFLDPEVLARVFTAAGFRIERAGTFARTDFPQDLQLDGRESVGMVAVKD